MLLSWLVKWLFEFLVFLIVFFESVFIVLDSCLSLYKICFVLVICWCLVYLFKNYCLWGVFIMVFSMVLKFIGVGLIWVLFDVFDIDWFFGGYGVVIIG